MLRPQHGDMHTERPPRISSWLVPVGMLTLGTYILLAAIALADLATARWGIWLVIGAAACFVGAGVFGARRLGPLLRG